MSKFANIEIELFGAFSGFKSDKALILQIPIGEGVAAIKAAILKHIKEMAPDFSNEKLIQVSAIANASSILGDEFVVESDEKLAILPPVNGG